jgi:hypothetical protein
MLVRTRRRSLRDDECILGSESDAHNQERENISHEEIILKKEESLKKIASQ